MSADKLLRLTDDLVLAVDGVGGLQLPGLGGCGLPLKPEQRALLQDSFARLQVLRQNTLTDAATTDSAEKRSVPIQVPAGQPVFPADIAERIPEFKEYGEALANPRAVR